MYAHVLRKWSLFKFLMYLIVTMTLLLCCQGALGMPLTSRQQIGRYDQANPFIQTEQFILNYNPRRLLDSKYKNINNYNTDFSNNSNNNNNINNNKNINNNNNNNNNKYNINNNNNNNSNNQSYNNNHNNKENINKQINNNYNLNNGNNYNNNNNNNNERNTQSLDTRIRNSQSRNVESRNNHQPYNDGDRLRNINTNDKSKNQRRQSHLIRPQQSPQSALSSQTSISSSSSSTSNPFLSIASTQNGADSYNLRTKSDSNNRNISNSNKSSRSENSTSLRNLFNLNNNNNVPSPIIHTSSAQYRNNEHRVKDLLNYSQVSSDSSGSSSSSSLSSSSMTSSSSTSASTSNETDEFAINRNRRQSRPHPKRHHHTSSNLYNLNNNSKFNSNLNVYNNNNNNQHINNNNNLNNNKNNNYKRINNLNMNSRIQKGRKSRKYCSARDPAALTFKSPTVITARLASLSKNRSTNFSVSFEIDQIIKQKSKLNLPQQIRLQFIKNNSECDIYRENFKSIGYINEDLENNVKYFLFINQTKAGTYKILGQPIKVTNKSLREVNNGASDKYGQPPRILEVRLVSRNHVNTTKEYAVDENVKIKLICKIAGRPPPKVTWFKDGRSIKNIKRITNARNKGRHNRDNKFTFIRQRNRSILIINGTTSNDAGEYVCRARNGIQNDMKVEKKFILKVNQKRVPSQDKERTGGDDCAMNGEIFCHNGGRCLYFKDINEFSCECNEGFEGNRCDRKVPSEPNTNGNYDEESPFLPNQLLENSMPNDASFSENEDDLINKLKSKDF